MGGYILNARAVLARLRDIAARLRLAATGFSIVSQNCIGGCMYHDLGLPFSSPTINLVIPGEGFVRLVEDLPRYLAVEAVPAGWRTEGEKRFPLLRVDDVIVHAMHYASGEEAAAAWNRRRKRVNLGDVRVIACDWDLGERPEPLVARLLACGYPTVVFSTRPSDNPSVVSLTGDGWHTDERGILRPILTDRARDGRRNFERAFDYVGWLNRA